MNNGQNKLQAGNSANNGQCQGPKCNMGRKEWKFKGSCYLLQGYGKLFEKLKNSV